MKTKKEVVLAFLVAALALPLVARARSIMSVTPSEDGNSVVVAYDARGEGDKADALYVAWDRTNAGDDIASWPNVRRVALLGEAAGSVTYAFPADVQASGSTLVARAFVATTSAPYDYLLDYVHGTGKQYIDTGYKVSSASCASLDVSYDNSTFTKQMRPFGVLVGSDADADTKASPLAFTFTVYVNGSGFWASALRNGEGDWVSSGVAPVANMRYRLTLDGPNKSFFLDDLDSGERLKTTTHTGEISQTSLDSLLVFASHDCKNLTTTSVRYLSDAGRLYAFSLTSNGVAQCAWTPCVLSGRAGVYDAVSNQILYSSSGTDFEVGGAANASTSVVSGDVVAARSAAVTVRTSVLPEIVVDGLSVSPHGESGIALDFTVSGATEDAAKFGCLEVAVTTNGVTTVAKTLTGATNCVNGAHRVFWNAKRDGFAVGRMSVTVSVGYRYLPYCVVDLSSGSGEDASYSVSYLAQAPDGDGFGAAAYKTERLVLKCVDAGTFKMQNYDDVTFSKAFYMGIYTVTQKQWELVTGSNPCSETAYGKGDALPVHWVSYDDIRGATEGAKWPADDAVDDSSFVGKLQKRSGVEFDMPTEAQWEYACRAGTSTTFSYGNVANGDYMWYGANASNVAHEVGTRLPNAWGLYDMHGNVWEWCRDWNGTLPYGTDPKGATSGTKRITRGGGWTTAAERCTSILRDEYGPSAQLEGKNGSKALGFRLVCPVPAAVAFVADSVDYVWRPQGFMLLVR